MNDLLAGLAIALVLEGLLWALAPDAARRMVRDIASLPGQQIAGVAWVMVAAGVVMFW